MVGTGFFFGIRKLPFSSKAFLAAIALAFAIVLKPSAAFIAPAETVSCFGAFRGRRIEVE